MKNRAPYRYGVVLRKECLEDKTSMAETCFDGGKERTNDTWGPLLLVSPPHSTQKKNQSFLVIENARKTRQEAKRSNKCREQGEKILEYGRRGQGERTHRPTTAKEAASQATPRQAQWSRPPSQSASALAAFRNPALTAISAWPSPSPSAPPPAAAAPAAARSSTATAAAAEDDRAAIPPTRESARTFRNRRLLPPKPPPFRQQRSRAGQEVLGSGCCGLTSQLAPAQVLLLLLLHFNAMGTRRGKGGREGVGVRGVLRGMRFCGGAGDSDVTVVAFGGQPLLCAQRGEIGEDQSIALAVSIGWWWW
jgi:hypothetical protein